MYLTIYLRKCNVKVFNVCFVNVELSTFNLRFTNSLKSVFFNIRYSSTLRTVERIYFTSKKIETLQTKLEDFNIPERVKSK